MQFVSDLHLHSKYSRAVSQNMTLPVMAQQAALKGLDILSASDFTHPLWFKEIGALLEEQEEGLYGLKTREKTRFLLSTEISCIGNHKGKLRRIHNLVFAPSLEVAEKIGLELRKRGCNLQADGRPIIGLNSKQLLELILEIDARCLLIPCHVWTPHFGVYGSASGYDSLEEAFEELAPHIYGIETGLSSDPEMNWLIPELMKRSILSFSDAHSPAKMGREATVLELENPSYENVRKAIMRKGVNRVLYTIEFYPEEGKYHFSGHRNCKVVFGPEEIKEKGNECPVCHRRLTEGVLYRLQQLADESLSHRVEHKMSPHQIKWFVDSRKNHPPYVKIVPLNEIIAECLSSTVFSQKVKDTYEKLCLTFGSEIEVLLKTPIEELRKEAGEKIAMGVERVRKGSITIDPGYDGEYGHVKIFEGAIPAENPELKEKKEQASMF